VAECESSIICMCVFAEKENKESMTVKVVVMVVVVVVVVDESFFLSQGTIMFMVPLVKLLSPFVSLFTHLLFASLFFYKLKPFVFIPQNVSFFSYF